MRLRRAAGFALLAYGVLGVNDPGWAQDVASTSRVPTITVEGVATREVVPDTATIRLGVVTERPTAAEAARDNARTARMLVDDVKANGVEDRDIATTEATLEAVYEARNGAGTSKFRAFRASNLVQIRIRNLGTAGDLAARLIDKGANALRGIEFTLSDPQPVLDALRADATRDARRKAALYADAAQVRLGAVLEIRPDGESAPYADRRLKMEALAPAPSQSVPLQAGSQTLEARVSITWRLEPSS